ADEGEIVEQPVFNRHGERTGERLAANPWIQIWKSADDQVRRYGAKFGLTPSDRTQLGRRPVDDSPASKKQRGAERLLS
ncbi:MAG: P27 family phage terminase small subunit, partial [Actinomycetota bacterium]